MASRWVVVDDTDGGIQYSGSWAAESGAKWDGQGNFGATYQDSLHSTTSTGSFSYTYDGSTGAIIGTTNIRNNSGVIDPAWECQLDGATIQPSGRFPYTENNWVLCQWDNISPGRHTVTVNVKSSGQAFLFDQLRYVPSPSANVQNAAILVDFRDSAIQYGDGWVGLGTIGRMAPNGGAVVTIPFYGTGFNWFSNLPIEMASGASTAEYTIDDGSTTTFTAPSKFGGNTQYNQLILSVRGLSRGAHTLKVTSGGRTSSTPLVLANLIIEGGATQEPATTPPSGNSGSNTSSGTTQPGSVTGSLTQSPGSNPSHTSTSSGNTANVTGSDTNGGSNAGNNTSTGGNNGSNGGNNNSGSTSNSNSGGSGQQISEESKTPIGPIVGGIIGALALIALVIFAILFYRRKNRSHGRPIQGTNVVEPFYRDVPREGPVSVSTEYSGGWGSQQAAHMGNTQAVFLPPTPSQNTHPNNTSGSYSTPLSPNRMGSHNVYASAPSSEAGFSEASTGSATGSTAALLQPNRRGAANSKYQETLSESSSQAPASGAQIINHEDSGVRLPPTMVAPPTQVIEYPPSYTQS